MGFNGNPPKKDPVPKYVEFYGGPYDGKTFTYNTVITTKIWLNDDTDFPYHYEGGELLHEYCLRTVEGKPTQYDYSGPLRLIDGKPVYE